jgi:hypothetical protein
LPWNKLSEFNQQNAPESIKVSGGTRFAVKKSQAPTVGTSREQLKRFARFERLKNKRRAF